MRELSASDFIAARMPVALGGDEIHLWLFRLDGQTAARANAARVRGLLAAYLGCAPAAVRLAVGEHGKPYLVDAPAPLEFNVSHSGGALLVAVARDQAIGVDIETGRRRRPVLELARRFFAVDEAQALASLDEDRRQIAFLRVWSCKEAVVKALGSGIAFGLERLQFGIDANGEPIALSVIHASAGAAADWHILRLAPGAGYVGALAWRGSARSVRAFVADVD